MFYVLGPRRSETIKFVSMPFLPLLFLSALGRVQRLIAPAMELVLTPDGITYGQHRFGKPIKIAWSEYKGHEVYEGYKFRGNGAKYIGVMVNDLDAFIERVTQNNRAAKLLFKFPWGRGYAVSINRFGLNTSLTEIDIEITRFSRFYKTAS